MIFFNMKIYPSILETNTQDFLASINRLTPYFHYFQLDIADGQLVPNTTVQIKDILAVLETSPLKFAALQWEFHLMVQDYSTHLKHLSYMSHMQIRRVLIHLKALAHTFEALSDQTPCDVGLVLNPEEGISEHWERIKAFPIMQLMTVNPGYQGAPFIPEVLDKIAQLREKGYKGDIILDGSINEESMKTIMQKPPLPDAVCPGSYFRADNVEERLLTLTSLAPSEINEKSR